MKIAIINCKGRFFSQGFLERYDSESIFYDFDTDLEKFLKNHPLKDYSGVLMHPPMGAHQNWLKLIQEKDSNIRIAFATTNLESTLQDSEVVPGIPLIDFKNIEAIKRYFTIN